MPPDSTERFTTRVDDYVKYRPSYPPELLPFLRDAIGLTPDSVIADLGSGTGISAELFLRHGNVVHAVEPNAAMRAAAERQLAPFANFHSVAAPATATTLPDHSIDVVTAMQAFHWFDPAATRIECRRILKLTGHAVVAWNNRLTAGSPFLEAYEHLLLKYATDYARVRENYAHPDALATFFGPAGYREQRFPNEQRLDFPALRGRLLSSSYVPQPGHPNHEPLLHAARQMFDAFNEDGFVRMTYETRVFYGTLA